MNLYEYYKKYRPGTKFKNIYTYEKFTIKKLVMQNKMFYALNYVIAKEDNSKHWVDSIETIE